MSDPGAPSAIVAQVSTSSGLGAITLGKTFANYMTFAQVYTDGDTIKYSKTDRPGISHIASEYPGLRAMINSVGFEVC